MLWYHPSCNHTPAARLASAVNVAETDWTKPWPAAEIPVNLINAALLGTIWGILRRLSGSGVVPALCQAVWNGIV